MNILQAIILGIIQGLTEFLPISSSAHLVLVPYLLNWHFPADLVLPFDTLVQLGTLVAVIVYFWKDLWTIITAWVKTLLAGKPFSDPDARLGWYLILATIPAGLLGITIKKLVEAAFQSALATALFLFVTAAILLIAERISKRTRPLTDLNWKDALIIGVGQAIAIFPGISRSGATISTGLARNFERTSAARFSFLMSIPVMLAAGLLEGKDLIGMSNLASYLPLIAIGFIFAAVVGYFSIRWVLAFLTTNSLKYFAFYCMAFGALVLVVYALR